MHIDQESKSRLFQAILSLRTEEECGAFLDDLCTIKELQAMAQRLDTAWMLDQGVNYLSITQEFGISAATISRVSRCLNYGAGGYRLVLDRMQNVEGIPDGT